MSDRRPESGAMKFGDDWTGVFFRGDTAFHYGIALKELLEQFPIPPADDQDSSPAFAKMILKGLVDDLLSCDERTIREQNTPVQKLRPFDECAWPGTLQKK
jgi:hypothetical protein